MSLERPPSGDSQVRIPSSPPSPPMGKERGGGPRFWRTLGFVLAADFIFTLLYTLINSGFSGRIWSDALCISSIVLGLASVLPFLLDAGRGFTMLKKMRGTDEERHSAWEEERSKREKGMTITFALFLAAFLAGLASVAVSLL